MKDPRAIIQRMMLTEKGTRMTEMENKYLFQVDPSANKIEIKRAIEQLFNVKVAKVNTMHRMGKDKRVRTMNYGKTSAWKRAVVTLKEGSKIELT